MKNLHYLILLIVFTLISTKSQAVAPVDCDGLEVIDVSCDPDISVIIEAIFANCGEGPELCCSYAWKAMNE